MPLVDEAPVANKELVRRWFALLDAGDAGGAAALTDPEGTFWSVARRAERSLPAWHEHFDGLVRRFPDGLRFDVGIMTAEGGRVCALVESCGRLADGRLYNNLYHWYFEVAGSRIVRVREYNDTLHAWQVLGPGGPPGST